MSLASTLRRFLNHMTFGVLDLDRPDTSFLFMDDSFCHEKTKVSALVGLLVPLGQYETLRNGFYSVFLPFIRPGGDVVARPPQLHGVELPGDTDEEKLRVVSEVVDLIVSKKIRIYRIGYYITKWLEEHLKDDKRLHGICWSSMMHMLKPELAKQLLIPVMDGIDPEIAKRFSPSIQFLDMCRTAGLEQVLSVSNSSHLVGEVFYADSNYSVFTQAADIVAYLRKITDMRDDGHSLPPFKEKLLKQAQRLNRSLEKREHVIAFRFNGVVHGPPHRAMKPGLGDHMPLVEGYSLDWAKANGKMPISDEMPKKK